MDKEQRIEYIVEMYQKIYPEQVIDRSTRINNAEIQKICDFEGPAYFRIRNWCEARIGKMIQTNTKGELDSKGDIEKFHSVLKECYELMQSRMSKYGNSWKIMDLPSIARLVMMKMDRISELGEDNAKTLDELQDTINYATFAIIKYKEKNEKK